MTDALKLETPTEALRNALAWYGEQARLARLIHSEGDAGRHALAEDGGKRAREVLALSALPAGVKPLETVRHKKRGTTYDVIGVGKMQAENWRELVGEQQLVEGEEVGTAVDMREVTVYRSTDDGQIWVRPVEEFNDGRFEPARILSAISPAGVETETPAPSPAPSTHLMGRWLPIAQADRTITNVEDFSEVGVILRTSDRYWVRDEDGRVYEAAWSDGNNGERDYWWDFDGESPVDPVEFMPHPLDPRFAALATTEGKDNG